MRIAGLRRERLAEAMRQVLSEIVLTDMKDPRLAGVVISAVELSGDLKQARAFYSLLGDEERERQVADAFTQARGFLRHEVGRRLRIHNAPELEFRRDKGFERADRLQRIFDEIAGGRAAEAAKEDDAASHPSSGVPGPREGEDA